ncbi:MAG: hypothetical protein II409_05455, partial [Clostridia bacterium]|nr:hypothetical protein [Clostridia bacterium]
MKTEGNSKSILTAAAELLGRNKRLRIAVCAALALFAALLFLTSGVFRPQKTGSAPTAQESPAPNADAAGSIERRLETVLSRMAGVGKVTVMLTLDQTEEQVLAVDGRSSSSETGSSTESRPATVSEGGKESPIVLTERLPRVRGVIVVAEGAANIIVRMN